MKIPTKKDIWAWIGLIAVITLIASTYLIATWLSKHNNYGGDETPFVKYPLYQSP